MDVADFHNRLRIMRSIDRHELVEAGALDAGDLAGWDAFNADPYIWFIKAPDPLADRVWAVIEQRAVRRPALADQDEPPAGSWGNPQLDRLDARLREVLDSSGVEHADQSSVLHGLASETDRRVVNDGAASN